jgi:hypothetical protein
LTSWTLGHFMAALGALLIVGPLFAPMLYDSFAAPITVFLGIGFVIFGLTFRKIMPRVGGGHRRGVA